MARDAVSKTDALGRLPLLEFLPAPVRAEVARRFVRASYPFGAGIVRAGDPADALYVLVSGRARVVKRGDTGEEVPLNVLRAGDAFGEMALLEQTTRMATVRASSDVEALRLVAVRITEGQAITPGTPAFVIRSAAAGDRSAEMRSLETQMTGTEESRRNTQPRYESQRRADQEEERRLDARAANLRDKLGEQRGLRDVREARFKRDLEIQGNDIEITEREIGFKKTQYTVAKELSDRLERYYKDGSISWLEYNNRKLEATKLAVERQQLERSLESSKLKLSQVRSEHQTWEIDWKLNVAALQTELTETQAALAGLRQTSGARAAEEREWSTSRSAASG